MHNYREPTSQAVIDEILKNDIAEWQKLGLDTKTIIECLTVRNTTLLQSRLGKLGAIKYYIGYANNLLALFLKKGGGGLLTN